MSSTPQIELYGLHSQIARQLEERGVLIERALVGNYLTSLDTFGALLSVLVVDDELLQLWDQPVCTSTLRWELSA